jgi:TIR domain-containing protein
MSEPSKPGFDVFLSHNSQDKLSARRLKERLLKRKLTVWFDEDELRPGILWQELLEEGIRSSRSVAVLLGESGLGPWENQEMAAALRLAVDDGRAVIPVLLPGAPDDVKLPLFLSLRTWVDLRPRVTAQKLDRLIWGITNQKPVSPIRDEATPHGTGPKKSRANPDSDEPIEPKWSDELRIYGKGFAGRRKELAAMSRAWAKGARIFALHAEGGVGKTRVVVEWLRRMQKDGWRGARRVFVHSFYTQGSGDERSNASSELFFEQALDYFGHRGQPITQAEERGRTLARLLVKHQGLLILDGLEPLQHPPLHAEQGRLKDLGLARLLLSLANAPHDGTRGLCLTTSRQAVIEIEGHGGATVIQQSLEHLHRDDGAKLLREFQVVGPDEDLKKAADEFHGHAYSLLLLGSFLKNATDHHDIRRRHEAPLLAEDIEHGSHARKMFAAYARHLGEDSPEVAALRLLGFFNRATERQLLDVLRAREAVVYEWSKELSPTDNRPKPVRIKDSLAEVTEPLLDLAQFQWNRLLNRLRGLRLVNFIGNGNSPAVDTHPLLRECFAEQVRTQFPAAWQAGHRRLFEHLGGTVPYWPEGIGGLQALYQAVMHGCLAGLYEKARAEIYRDRILRGTEADGLYSTRKLGAIGEDLGAVACFFVTPWTIVTPTLAPHDQVWLLNDATYGLRALGRLIEAVEPIRVAIELTVNQNRWESAALCSGNLSELELIRGEVSAAVTAGEQSVAYADLSGKLFEQMIRRTTLADALHQAGRHNEAWRLFEDAESRQAARQPKYPRLYSLAGFCYCDLLLAGAERAAWQSCLRTPSDHVGGTRGDSLSNTTCDAVSERASEWFGWRTPTDSLLEIALEHLTLARATLYGACFASSIQDSTMNHIAFAVDNLRTAGDLGYIPSGLLTRSWVLCLSGDEAACRADLDEAWEIAERGPMPLHQADIQLYRARLFRDRAALAEARRLIEKHGYHRRDGELADAEEAAKGW